MSMKIDDEVAASLSLQISNFVGQSGEGWEVSCPDCIVIEGSDGCRGTGYEVLRLTDFS